MLKRLIKNDSESNSEYRHGDLKKLQVVRQKCQFTVIYCEILSDGLSGRSAPQIQNPPFLSENQTFQISKSSGTQLE
jgi:hypothetical protein